MGYVTGIQATGMYADLWDGLANFSSTGVTLPVTGSVFAINYVRLGVPDIQKHPDYDLAVAEILARAPAFRFVVVDGDTIFINSVQEYLAATGASPAGLFSDTESAIFFTFAKYNQFTLDLGWSYFTIPLEMPIGLNLKLLNNKLGESSGTGIGADGGIQFRFPLDEIVRGSTLESQIQLRIRGERCDAHRSLIGAKASKMLSRRTSIARLHSNRKCRAATAA